MSPLAVIGTVLGALALAAAVMAAQAYLLLFVIRRRRTRVEYVVVEHERPCVADLQRIAALELVDHTIRSGVVTRDALLEIRFAPGSLPLRRAMPAGPGRS